MVKIYITDFQRAWLKGEHGRVASERKGLQKESIDQIGLNERYSDEA